MSHERVAELGRDLVRAWNAHDADRIVGLHAPKYVGIDVAEAAPRHGREGIRRVVEIYLRAFPDLQLTVEDMLVDGNRLVVLWIAHGTHVGSVMRIPPTHRPIEVRGLSVLTIEAGMITRAFHHWDVAGMLRNLGLLPELLESDDLTERRNEDATIGGPTWRPT